MPRMQPMRAARRWNPAQIPRKHACATRNHAPRPQRPALRDGAHAHPSHVGISHRCGVRHRSLWNRCEPRQCLLAGNPCAARMQSLQGCRKRGVAAIAGCRHDVPDGCGEKLCERLLTLEKSVIRFRPADISCGSKWTHTTRRPEARHATPPDVRNGGCRQPVTSAQACRSPRWWPCTKPAALRAAGFLLGRRWFWLALRAARMPAPHPFRRAWRVGGRSQVRYLRRLS